MATGPVVSLRLLPSVYIIIYSVFILFYFLQIKFSNGIRVLRSFLAKICDQGLELQVILLCFISSREPHCAVDFLFELYPFPQNTSKKISKA